MKRLLLDQGLPRSAVVHLRESGWDAVHARERGLSRASDMEILEAARRESRVCVTLDADFHAFLAVTAAPGPSVVRIRAEGLDGRALADLCKAVWPHIEKPLADGAMVTVTKTRIRVRRLPVHQASDQGEAAR